MATRTPVQLDRQRIAELTEREAKRLNERTGGSKAMYARARGALSGGVASSYQLRDPWPIYLERGDGAYVWDVDGTRMIDYHNGFGSMVQGHGHPVITKAVAERMPEGTHFAAPTEDAIIVAEELKRRWGLPQWRYVNSGSEATMDAIRIARAKTGRDTIVKIFGSYHGHHDYVMVSIGVPYDKIGDPDNLASLPYGGGIPQVGRRHDHRRAVQRPRRHGAPHRAPDQRGPEARLRDHGGGDDEPRGRAARAGLPRGRPRAHPQARHRAHLRRGQDRPDDRPGRRDRVLRRHAGHGHAGQGARRRPPVRRDRRHRGRHVRRRGRHRLPGRHLQREPARRWRRPAPTCSTS